LPAQAGQGAKNVNAGDMRQGTGHQDTGHEINAALPTRGQQQQQQLEQEQQ